MIGRAVIPTADFGMGGRPTELNHVPLISAGGSASGASRGDEVGKVSVVARAWPREPLIKAREKQIAAGFDGGGGVGVGGEGAWMLSAMATDMIDKQQALDEAIVLLDRERKRTQQLKFRCDEATAAKQRLESDNAELRRLLHEERNADPAAGLEQLGLGGVNDVMEAKERLGQLAARYGQEKRRNAELIHRLKAMHESQASAEQLKGRHLELQEAHAEMSRYLQKLEREAGRVAKCRATIEMQEGIIARLEGLLEQSVVDQRRLAEAEAIASRVQDANTVLQAGPDWEELSMLRDEVKDLRTAYSEREQDHKDLQSERIALTLRAEKAEANAIASNNEMLDVSRKAAREIASLRAKLAEKDAQLMGGFGSVANMVLQEMPRRRGSRRWSRSPRSTPRRPEREVRGYFPTEPEADEAPRGASTATESAEWRTGRGSAPHPEPEPGPEPRDREACPRDRPRRSRRRARGPSREGLARVRWVEVRDRRVERRRHRRGRGLSRGTNRGRPIDDGSKAPRSHSSTVRVMHRLRFVSCIVYSACDASSRAFRLYSSRPAPRDSSPVTSPRTAR